MPYLLFIIAGLWMADGLVLLLAPDRMMTLLRQTVKVAPSLLKWGGVAAVLGMALIVGTNELSYHLFWVLIGVAMIGKGIFLLWAPEEWQRSVIGWCLGREPIDYRFWGLGLCALSLLLLNALVP